MFEQEARAEGLLVHACTGTIRLTTTGVVRMYRFAQPLSDKAQLIPWSDEARVLALITTTPNMRCVITLLAPLTLTVHPPWLPLRW